MKKYSKNFLRGNLFMALAVAMFVILHYFGGDNESDLSGGLTIASFIFMGIGGYVLWKPE